MQLFSVIKLLVITPSNQYLLQGENVNFTATMPAGLQQDDDVDVTGDAAWGITKAPNGVTINGKSLTVGDDANAGKFTVTAKYNGISGSATVTVLVKSDSLSNPGSLKEQFGIDTDGQEAVKDTFTALHEFIKAGGLENANTKDVIKLGDYIDLESGLAVDAYGEGDNTGAFSSLNNEDWNKTIQLTASGTQYPTGTLNRLIVVGINSFHSNRGVVNNGNTDAPTYNGDENGQYKIEDNDDTSHVVFQFQNIPVNRRMNPTDSNTGGYPASEMRKYLVPIKKGESEETEGGNFLDGLIKAGVPKDVLWAPSRVMATSDTTTETIKDLLWLPTEREISGTSSYAAKKGETAANQARLEYYLSRYGSLAAMIAFAKVSKDTDGFPGATVFNKTDLY
jgi:hypothetical protein